MTHPSQLHWILSMAVLTAALTVHAAEEINLRPVPEWDGAVQKLDAEFAMDGNRVYISGTDLAAPQGMSIRVIEMSPNAVTTLGSIPGAYDTLAARDGFVYAALPPRSIAVVDARDPANPGTPATLDVGGLANRVVLQGDLLVLPMAQAGLAFVDVRDPSRPRIAGSLSKGLSTAEDVCLRGDLAYVAAGPDGIVVVDFSEPSTPAVIGQVPTDGAWIYSVAVVGHTLYAQRWTGTVGMYDLTDPLRPALVGQFAGGSVPAQLQVGPDVLMLIDIAQAVTVHSLEDPRKPQQIAELTAASASRVFAGQGRLWVGSRNQDVRTYTLDQIANPQPVAQHPLRQNRFQSIYGTDRGYLHVSVGGMFFTMDVANPVSPVPVATNASPISPRLVLAGDVGIGYPMGALPPVSLSLLDLSNPARPSVNRVLDGYDARAIAAEPGRYFVGGNTSLGWWELKGLQEQAVTNISLPFPCLSLVLRNNLLYVGSSEPALEVLDVSAQGGMTRVGRINLPSAPHDMAYSEGRLILLGQTAPGLSIVSLADPRNPLLLASLAGSQVYESLAVHGSYAYARIRGRGFDVIDLTHPGQLQRVGGNDVRIDDLGTDGRALYTVSSGRLRVLPLFANVPAYRPLAPRLNTGRFGLHVRGIPGSTIRIDRATSLGAWTEWRTALFASELLEIIEDDQPTGDTVFFRIRLP